MSASTQNTQVPFDPTAYTSISGAQIKQLIDGIDMYADKGLILKTTDVGVTADVPNAVATTEWQRYIWLRITASAAVPYVWNPTAPDHIDSDGNNLRQWRTLASSSIGIGTITNEMIADNTIQDGKIVGLSAGKLSGNLPDAIRATIVESGDAAGGSLAGNYPDPVLAPNSVGASQIVNGSITSAKIEDGSTTTGIAADKLKCSGSGYAILRTNSGATDAEWATIDIANTSKLTNITAGDSLKIVRINSGETAYEKVAPTGANGIGNVLQTLAKAITATSGTTVMPYANTVPQNTQGDEIASLTITPKSSTSILRIKLVGWGEGATNAIMSAALFKDSDANAIAAVSVSTETANAINPIPLEAYVASPGAGVATTYKIRVGCPANGWYFMRSNSTTIFGAAAVGYLVIEELIGTIS